MSVNGLDLGMLTSKMRPEDMRQLGGAVDASLLVSSLWPFIAMTFVVFFYCLGALYDERKDRSVLFWKSLPLSDRDTVLSKVASAGGRPADRLGRGTGDDVRLPAASRAWW